MAFNTEKLQIKKINFMFERKTGIGQKLKLVEKIHNFSD